MRVAGWKEFQEGPRHCWACVAPWRGLGVILAKGSAPSLHGAWGVCGSRPGVQMEEGDNRGEQVRSAHGEHARMCLPSCQESPEGGLWRGQEVIWETGRTERGPTAREEFSARGRMGRRSRTVLGSPRSSREGSASCQAGKSPPVRGKIDYSSAMLWETVWPLNTGCKLMLLRPCGAHPLGELVKMQILTQQIWNGAWDAPLLTSSPVGPVLLPQHHSEQLECKALCVDMGKYLGLW